MLLQRKMAYTQEDVGYFLQPLRHNTEIKKKKKRYMSIMDSWNEKACIFIRRGIL